MCEEEVYSYFKRFASSKILMLSDNNILKKPHLRGEDYFAYTLFQGLITAGLCCNIEVFDDNEKSLIINRRIENHDVIILFNISPLKIWTTTLKLKPKVVMIVYQLWNNTDPLLSNLRSCVGLTLLQWMIDVFIVTSPKIARRLRVQGIRREKILIIPPIFKCKYCNQEENKRKLTRLKTRLPRKVIVSYIGSINKKRLPLNDAIRTMILDQKRKYQINIYTGDSIKSRSFAVKNVKVNIFRSILSDVEKCKILQESSIFIAPRPKTTMDPPISEMEAKYHGNLIMRAR